MKKTYMKPETLSVPVQMVTMIAASDSVSSEQLPGVTLAVLTMEHLIQLRVSVSTGTSMSDC